MTEKIGNNFPQTKKPDFCLTLEKTWNLRLLTSDCADEIAAFITLFNDFFQLCEGENGSWEGILNACPPSKDIHRDKWVLGLYDELALIGLADIIRDYPQEGSWTIGYLLIHPDYRNQGLGHKFIHDLEIALSPFKLRCVVQEQNTRALNFWKSVGFIITSKTKDRFGESESITYVMEK